MDDINKFKLYSNYIFNIGKYKNKNTKIIDIVTNDKNYCSWFISNYIYKDNKS